MSRTTAKLIFDVRPDFTRFPGQWFLDEPLSVDGTEIDAREFTEGVAYRGMRPATVPIANMGKEVAFHLGAFDMPVVSRAVGETITRIAGSDVEVFPIDVPTAKGNYSILNVICRLECLDESRSEFTRWKEEDRRPDRLGDYHVISTIRVNAERTGSHHIFRLRDWPLALLVSDTLRDALEGIPNLGIDFHTAS